MNIKYDEDWKKSPKKKYIQHKRIRVLVIGESLAKYLRCFYRLCLTRMVGINYVPRFIYN